MFFSSRETHRSFPRVGIRLLVLACLLLLALPALACNIPVFRYALERWQSDRLEVIVLTENEMDAKDRARVERLRDYSASTSGSANIQVRVANLREQKNAPDQELWSRIKQMNSEHDLQSSTLPHLVVRGKGTRPIIYWSGPIDQVSQVSQSPIRTTLAKRLTSGDAIVWLVLQSKEDSAANEKVNKLLQTQTVELSKMLELPEGIGLPGSELFSEVPLLLRFSVLTFDRESQSEGLLISLCKYMQPEAFAADEPLVIPVFGRGRALEVIPASQLDAALVRDLTSFLCAACSCQVKEQNPGFDLLLSVDWDLKLFGQDGQRPPASEKDGLRQRTSANRAPTLLQIPPGRAKQ